MKINPIHSVNAYKKVQEVNVKQNQDVAKKRDDVQISSAAKQMQQSTQVSVDRQEKIEKLKAQIEQGEYKVNPNEVARKFYDFWNEK
ncbi:flagellar biosynthesis anti-sigma factor FlgM [Evansella cellulosilytica]|uniref:Negative regulator of flagellin synthesis n=1 Tax=Evansella cellulosilytica (strain ATCC 21833 / DSM 2522 / FERM P-1141 / JCM 9156 / N-4) TaxID=649639 RepID=E6TS99_EVAC2|nr:flagellar biosynthesis anti-sigma factor FlgM [Evansella cellulosilytica]ADU31868.1 Anti-sigma-28 factor FlgM family protein [Evansella cellulosilytica DSM 2522]